MAAYIVMVIGASSSTKVRVPFVVTVIPHASFLVAMARAMTGARGVLTTVVGDGLW